MGSKTSPTKEVGFTQEQLTPPPLSKPGAAKRLCGHNFGVECVDYSPNAPHLIVSGGIMGTARIWNTDGECIQTLEGERRVSAVSFSLDGKKVFTSGYRYCYVWDLESGERLETLEAFGVNFFVESNELLFCASLGEIVVFETEYWTAEEKITCSSFSGGVMSLVLMPDGERLISGDCEGKVIVWEISTDYGMIEKKISTDFENVLCLELANNSNYLAVGGSLNSVYSDAGGYKTDGECEIWDIDSCTRVHRFKGHTSRVARVRFTYDGRHLLSASSDKSIRVWDTSTGCCVAVMMNHTSNVYDIALSPNNDQVCAASIVPWGDKTRFSDDNLLIWDISAYNTWLNLRREFVFLRRLCDLQRAELRISVDTNDFFFAVVTRLPDGLFRLVVMMLL